MTTYFYSHNKAKNDDTNIHVLSQWYMSSFVDENGLEYNCAEQYMMAEKARLFLKKNKKNQNIIDKIMKTNTQSLIKKLGREVLDFDVNEWNNNKFNIVIKGNMLKFGQNEELKKILLDTGKTELVEASPYDPIWGIGYTATTAKKTDRSFWGQNLLGKALMNVRDKL